MKDKLISELKSFAMTFITIFSVEGYLQLISIYQGDWSITVWQAVGFACLRSAIKAMLQIMFPKIFPNYQSK